MKKEKQPPSKDQLQDALNQLKQAIHILESKEDTSIREEDFSPRLEAQVADFEMSVEALRQRVEEYSAETVVDPSQIDTILSTLPSWLPPEQRQTLKELEKYKEQVEAIRDKRIGGPVKRKKTAPGKQSPGARKNRFKEIGGDTWQKL